MSSLVFLIDVSPNPVGGGTAALIILLAIVFVLAVSFTAGLVLLLIWIKRSRVTNSAVGDMRRYQQHP